MSKTALKDAIKACGHSQKKLADRLKVSRYSVNKWLNDESRDVPRWYRDAVLEIAREVRK